MSRRAPATPPAASPRQEPSAAQALGSLPARRGWLITWAALALLVFWLLRSVFAVLLASAALAWLLDPLIDRWEGRGRSRVSGILLLFTGVFLGGTVVGLPLTVTVVQEIRFLAENLVPYLESFPRRLEPLQDWVLRFTGYKLPLSPEALELSLREALDSEPLQEQLREAAPSLGDLISGAVTSGMAFAVGLLNLLLIPIFSFYLLRDWDLARHAALDLVPPRHRGAVSDLGLQIHERLTAFVRGQVTVAAALGAMYVVGLSVSGVDLAVAIGLVAGVLSLVPYLGTAFGVVVATVLVLLEHGVAWNVIGVWVTFAVAQGIEGTFLTPWIVGDRVGVHPLVVMVALLVGAYLFGIAGMLVAIPLTAAAQVLLGEWLERYRASTYFRGRA